MFVQADEHADSFWSDWGNFMIIFLGCEKTYFSSRVVSVSWDAILGVCTYHRPIYPNENLLIMITEEKSFLAAYKQSNML